jgi:hypothetical protein
MSDLARSSASARKVPSGRLSRLAAFGQLAGAWPVASWPKGPSAWRAANARN